MKHLFQFSVKEEISYLIQVCLFFLNMSCKQEPGLEDKIQFRFPQLGPFLLYTSNCVSTCRAQAYDNRVVAADWLDERKDCNMFRVCPVTVPQLSDTQTHTNKGSDVSKIRSEVGEKSVCWQIVCIRITWLLWGSVSLYKTDSVDTNTARPNISHPNKVHIQLDEISLILMCN